LTKATTQAPTQASIETPSEGRAAIQRRLRAGDIGIELAIKRAPKQHRAGLIWLHGFFLDVTQIAYRVDEPLLAEIRLQWWRDSFAKILRGERIGHPVADGLAPFLQATGPKLHEELMSIINSFGHEIQKTPVQTKTQFFDIYTQRYGAFLRTSYLISNLDPTPQNELLEKAGLALGISQTLADLPKSMQHNMMLLPQDILDEHNLTYQDIFEVTDPETVRQALTQMTKGACIISWDIKKNLARLPRSERALLIRWLLVPALFSKAIEDRTKKVRILTRINPIHQFITLWMRVL